MIRLVEFVAKLSFATVLIASAVYIELHALDAGRLPIASLEHAA